MKLKKTVEREAVEDMRGLFVVVKGQYDPKKEPAITCQCDKGVRFIGGYDPKDPATKDWWQLMDREHCMTVCCGGSLENVLKGVYSNIVRFKNNRFEYFKSNPTIEVYDDESGKKSTRSSVNPISTDLFKAVIEEYGDYYEDMVEEMEQKAIAYLESGKDMSLVSPRKTHTATKDTPAEKSTTPLKKVLKKTIQKDVEEEEECSPFDGDWFPPVEDEVEAPKKKVLKKKRS